MTRDMCCRLYWLAVTLLSIQRDKSVGPDAVAGTPPPPRFFRCNGETPFPKLTARIPQEPTRVQLLPKGKHPILSSLRAACRVSHGAYAERKLTRSRVLLLLSLVFHSVNTWPVLFW